MSNEDISMVCDVLLGITNQNKDIRTNSVNKLQELSKNLGALTFCLIEIASKTATNEKEKIVKTTALVICRKILDTQHYENWKKIDANLKAKIKLSALNLLNNETDPTQNYKVCDLIVIIMEKVLDSDEEWPELFNLALSICNFDPNDNSKFIQIRTLLRLLLGGTGYMYSSISGIYNKLIPYLGQLLDSGIDMKIKSLASELVGELISFCDEDEIKLFKELIKKIFDNIYKCYLMKDKMPEESIKIMLERCIQTETIEPSLYTPIFDQIFVLAQKLIEKKDYDDEKIRELAFELILNLVEEKPSLFKSKKKDSKKLSPFLEMVFNYALEFDKEYDQSWGIPSGNNYDNNKDDSADDKVVFSLSVIDRIIECMGVEDCEKELKQILTQYLQKGWEYQYFAFYVLASYSSFDQEITKVENTFKLIFNSTSSEHPKLRFSAVHCINAFCDNYNPSFQTQTIKELIPLLENLLKKETVLRNQCEIISTIISFMQFTTSNDLKPYIKELLELLLILFKQDNIPVIIRKLVLEALLEITSTMEEDITPYASITFDLILNYFIDSYKNKTNPILYGVLIEGITSLGNYIKEKYNPIVPQIVNCIVEIVKGFNSDKFEPIRADLTNSLKRLIPILQENYKNLLPNLIETVLILIKLRPQMAISSSPTEQFDVNKLLNDEEDKEKDKEKEIQTSETEELATSLSLLNTIIVSIGKDFLQYVEQVEAEIVQLLTYRADQKVRTKSSKILPNLLLPIKDNDELRIKKGKYYLTLLVEAISKETSNHVCEKLFVHLREVIENSGQILNKVELNELFDKITTYFDNLKVKRNKLINSKKEKKLKKHNDDDEDDENIQDLIDEDIKNYEDIQSEIADNIGMLLKTHKQIADEIITKILTNIIPSYSNSENIFEVKMGLFIADDLIEYIGQDMLGHDNWSLMYKIVTGLVVNKDTAIRQAAAYGIGNFARFTTNNFDNYSKGLIDALYNAMNIKKGDEDQDDDDEEYNTYGMSVDNMVSALGKIINYQFNSTVVQAGLNELIRKWIMNLPIKYDETEKDQQHEWLADLFLTKRHLINEDCYNHYFETLAKIYETKSGNDTINESLDKKIKNIFNDYVKKEDKLKQVVDQIYANSDETIKKKLEKLIK